MCFASKSLHVIFWAPVNCKLVYIPHVVFNPALLARIVFDVALKLNFQVKPFVRPTADEGPRPHPSGGGEEMGPGSDFYAIRDRCLSEKFLYEDPDFPAEDRSLMYSRSPPYGIEWLRPHVGHCFVLAMLVYTCS